MDNFSKKLFILRGLPGSGKSVFAEVLVYHVIKEYNFTTSIRNTNTLFIDSDGNYKFDASKLNAHEEENQRLVEKDMITGIDLIVVDNPNMTLNEMMPYMNLAKFHGYELIVQHIGNRDPENIRIYHQRNQYNIPLSEIERMASRFERMP